MSKINNSFEYKKGSIERIDILGVPVDFGYTMSSFLTDVEKNLLESYGNHISTTNPEFIMLAQKNPDFMDIIKRASYSVPDGTGVLLAKEYLSKVDKTKKLFLPIKIIINFIFGMLIGFKALLFGLDEDRITGVSLLDKVCALSAEKGYSIFLFGGWPVDKKGNMMNIDVDVANLTAEHFRKKYPDVNIIGATSKFKCTEEDDISSVKYIKRCILENGVKDLDFLFLCYPQYKQEQWIVRNSLNIPVKVSIGVGRSFNYYSNYMDLPSSFVTKVHLEWLYTLIKQPWRFKRIIQAFPIFPLRLYIKSLSNS